MDHPGRPQPSFGQPVDSATQNAEAPKYIENKGSAEVEPATQKFLPDLSQYTLTVPQASQVMKSHRCKFSSERKVQGLCSSEKVDCYRLSSIRNGNNVTEWLVNGTSLLQHIEDNERKLSDDEPTPATQENYGDANVEFGDAVIETSGEEQGDAENDLASRDQFGDAEVSSVSNDHVEDEGDARIETHDAEVIPATPKQVGVATPEVEHLIEMAEVRARLEAKLEAKDELIEVLKEDKRLADEKNDKLQSKVFDLTEASFEMVKVLGAGWNSTIQAELIDSKKGGHGFPHEGSETDGV